MHARRAAPAQARGAAGPLPQPPGPPVLESTTSMTFCAGVVALGLATGLAGQVFVGRGLPTRLQSALSWICWVPWQATSVGTIVLGQLVSASLPVNTPAGRGRSGVSGSSLGGQAGGPGRVGMPRPSGRVQMLQTLSAAVLQPAHRQPAARGQAPKLVDRDRGVRSLLDAHPTPPPHLLCRQQLQRPQPSGRKPAG